MATYIACRRVRHSVTRLYYNEGEIVPVDHLSPAQVDMLIAQKILRQEEQSVVQVGPVVEAEVYELPAEPKAEPQTRMPTGKSRKVSEGDE